MSNVSGAKELDILLLNVQIKKTMILLDNGEIESESSSDDEIPPLEDCSDVDVAEPINGDVLVTRHALNMQPKEGGDEDQREKLGCTYVTITLLVDKLGLPILKHPNPYRL